MCQKTPMKKMFKNQFDLIKKFLHQKEERN